MDKKSLSKRDICTKFITPAITQARLDIQRQVRGEFCFTNSRIMVQDSKLEYPSGFTFKGWQQLRSQNAPLVEAACIQSIDLFCRQRSTGP